eukprot:COSAG02_NODE_9485_length_2203_cov_2.793726_2_plen_60_part_00
MLGHVLHYLALDHFVRRMSSTRRATHGRYDSTSATQHMLVAPILADTSESRARCDPLFL